MSTKPTMKQIIDDFHRLLNDSVRRSGRRISRSISRQIAIDHGLITPKAGSVTAADPQGAQAVMGQICPK